VPKLCMTESGIYISSANSRFSLDVNPDAYFAFGLDLLIAGIEAMAARNR
jgi:hypothetical protein